MQPKKIYSLGPKESTETVGLNNCENWFSIKLDKIQKIIVNCKAEKKEKEKSNFFFL